MGGWSNSILFPSKVIVILSANTMLENIVEISRAVISIIVITFFCFHISYHSLKLSMFYECVLNQNI